jgi:hypothetical protein
MWQNLLAERYKLGVHREEKETAVYRLVVAKGGTKLKESPDERVGDAGADVADGPSLLDALERQLGLKVEQARAQIDVLVVDHIERSPIEN